MKIDLVIGSLQSGGAERQLCGLAKHLHELEKMDVCVVTLFDGGPLSSLLHDAGVPHLSLAGRSRFGICGSRWLRGALAWWRLRNYWRSRNPDAIQAWLPEAQIVALPVARSLGVPCRVMAIRSMADAVRHPFLAWLGLRHAARCASVAVSNSEAALCDAAWPIGNIPRRLVPNGVQIPETSACPEVQPPRAVVVANLTPVKGHHILFEALASMTSPLTVDLIGRGPLAMEIERAIVERSLGAHVSVLGAVDDVMPYLHRYQFAILPSRSEGLPNALLEAMAVGLPVVAFRVGGIPEIVEDGVTGVLAEHGDALGLATAIERVIRDPEWRARAGTIARERMRDFSWPAFTKRHLETMAVSTKTERR